MNRFNEILELVKSKNSPGLVGELMWVFLGQLLNIGLGFVIIKLLSKLGTYEYGIYALVLTISSLLALTFHGPLLQGFIRFYHHYFVKDLGQPFIIALRKALLLSGTAFLFITIVIFLFSFFINFNLSAWFFLFAGIFILAVRTSEFFNGFLNLIRKRKENSLLQGGEKIFWVLALLALIYYGKYTLLIIFIFFTVITSVFTFIKIKVFQKNLPFRQKEYPVDSLREIKTQITNYTMPFLAWGITGWLQLNGEKWIIAAFLTTSGVGIYAVMMSLVNAFIAIPSNVLSEFSTPIIFQNYADPNNKEKIKSGYRFIILNMILVFLVTIAVSLLCLMFGKEIIILISSADYAVYWYLLPALCFGSGLFYTGQSLTTLGMALNQPSKYIPAKIISGILSVLLNLVLIKIYGIAGAAITVTAVGLFYLIYIFAINRKMLLSK